MALHCITLHYTTLHYITLHYITLHTYIHIYIYIYMDRVSHIYLFILIHIIYIYIYIYMHIHYVRSILYIYIYMCVCVCTVYRIPMYRQAQSLCYHSCLSVILQNPQDLQKGSELRVIQGAIDHQNPTGSRALQVLWVAGAGGWGSNKPIALQHQSSSTPEPTSSQGLTWNKIKVW